jgi:hypothetical protein
MENKGNYLNNTLNIFSILNYKDNFDVKKSSSKDKINIKKLWELAHNPYKKNSDLKIVLNDKQLSSMFYKILKDSSLFYFPKVNAASSNSIERKSKDFEIISFSSKKDKRSIYIKIKFFVKIDKTIKNLYVGKKNNFLYKELPRMINNEIQFILNLNDSFFILLQDPDSEIFIR